MSGNYGRIARDGLWDNNIVFAQVLGLCPTMAVTSSATNGLGMGLATTVVLLASNIIISTVRDLISPDVRIPVYIVLIATLVTLVDVSLNAWAHDLYKVLGLYIALIVANCAVLGRAEAFAAKAGVGEAAMDGLMMGLGFTLALTTIGGIREVLGAGTLFANAHLLLGSTGLQRLPVDDPSTGRFHGAWFPAGSPPCHRAPPCRACCSCSSA
jgi:electron transport complex protein RnfE